MSEVGWSPGRSDNVRPRGWHDNASSSLAESHPLGDASAVDDLQQHLL
jgi:hypothetical protein